MPARNRHELLVLAAARELPRIALDDALRICLVLRDGDPDRYERVAVRWLGRFALEGKDVTIEDLRLAVDALDALPSAPARRWSGFSGCAWRMGCAEARGLGAASEGPRRPAPLGTQSGEGPILVLLGIPIGVVSRARGAQLRG